MLDNHLKLIYSLVTRLKLLRRFHDMDNNLYQLGYMEGLTGMLQDDYALIFISSKYLKGLRQGYLIRSEFYKPDLNK